MEVHAHTHTPRKKWTHYFWEFLMLFLAVFCGFLAENFREHQVEHKRTRLYAKQFINEIALDTQQINIGMQFVKEKDKEVDSLLKALTDLRPKEINYWALNIDVYYVAKLHSDVFEQIKNSGYLRNFKDEKLITAIQDCVNYRDNVVIVQDALASFYNNQLTPFLNKNFDLSFRLTVGSENRPTFDSLWQNHSLSFPDIVPSTKEMLEFKNMLIAIRGSYNLNFFYPKLKKKCEMLITQLKSSFHIAD